MHRVSLRLSLMALTIGTALHAQSAKRPMTFSDVMELKNLGSVALSPAGDQIVYSVSAWEHPNAKSSSDPTKPDTAKGDKHDVRGHLWLVSTNGGAPRQITFGERGESSPQWSPDGRSIGFLTSRGAGTDVKTQVWILPMSGGEAYQLSESKESITGFNWSKDGSRIAFLAVDTMPKTDEAKRQRRDDPLVYEGNFRLSHLWVMDVATKRANEIVHGDFTVRGAPSWSPDGQRLAFSASPTTLVRDERTDAYIATIATHQLEKVYPRSEVQGAPAWSPDGRTLALAALPQSHKGHGDSIPDRELANNHIILYDVASRTAKDVYDPKIDLSPGGLQWSTDGSRLVFSVGDRAYSSIYSYDVATNKYTKVVDKKLIRGLSWSKDGRTVAFGMDTPDAPADVYVSDATFSSPRKLTDINPQIRDLALGETEVVTWKSSDGTPVEGILLKPVGYQPGQRYPMLVEAHGGPTGASNVGFKANWGSPGQVWAGKGWATLYPNPRGSTNYGEKFMKANIMDWGGGDYRDIMSGVDEMVRRGIADSTKLAFEGWSYGGYMTAWVVSQTSRFKAARMGAGLSDLQSMYGTTDIPGYIGTFFSGMPTQKTLDFYRQRSAITFVDNVTTPLLILHGGQDDRVPVGQAMEYFRALKDRGKTVQLVFYPREGHGFGEYYHQMDKMQREYDWITRYTLNKQSALVP